MPADHLDGECGLHIRLPSAVMQLMKVCVEQVRVKQIESLKGFLSEGYFSSSAVRSSK